MSKTITVTLVRSTIGCTKGQKATVMGLGLKKPGSRRQLKNTPSIRGMIKTVIHLLRIES